MAKSLTFEQKLAIINMNLKFYLKVNMSNLEKLNHSFAENHPSVGEVKQGTTLTSEKVREFTNIFSSKIVGLSRKRELTKAEGSLISTVCNLNARNIAVSLNSVADAVKNDEEYLYSASKVAGAISKIAEVRDREMIDVQDFGVDVRRTEEVLSEITGTALHVHHPAYRVNVEDAAIYGLEMFAKIAEHQDALKVNPYFESNFKTMIAHFEMVEQQAVA
jgi:hypothetical protein